MAKVTKSNTQGQSKWQKAEEKQVQRRCGDCKHYMHRQNKDGFGHDMGICLNVHSDFKTFYRYEENHCVAFEPETT